MRNGSGRIILRDSTLREGLDVPGVSFDLEQKRMLLALLADAGIPEAELVAPGHFDRDLDSLLQLGGGLPLAASGLIYGNIPGWREQVARAKGALDRVDILMPLSDQRPPAGHRAKSALLREVLPAAGEHLGSVGAGFPHATQAGREILLDLCGEAVRAGAERITLYDTNGSADPWEVETLVREVCDTVAVEVCFHPHNDLGMATANAVAAVRGGAGCLDVTVNGLGDRAGNASLEQVAVVLALRGMEHGIRLERLPELSRSVAAWSGIPVAKLAPVVGEMAFSHKSPGHFGALPLFEAFDPALVGASRRTCEK